MHFTAAPWPLKSWIAGRQISYAIGGEPSPFVYIVQDIFAVKSQAAAQTFFSQCADIDNGHVLEGSFPELLCRFLQQVYPTRNIGRTLKEPATTNGPRPDSTVALVGRSTRKCTGTRLQFDLCSKVANDMAHNRMARRLRAKSLERFGAFRDELLPGTKFEHAYKPKGRRRDAPCSSKILSPSKHSRARVAIGCCGF
jgi:hypothetical protein